MKINCMSGSGGQGDKEDEMGMRAQTMMFLSMITMIHHAHNSSGVRLTTDNANFHIKKKLL
jgi:hypothetical protein